MQRDGRARRLAALLALALVPAAFSQPFRSPDESGETGGIEGIFGDGTPAAGGPLRTDAIIDPFTRFPRTHGTLEQGEGADGVREMVEKLAPRPGEMIMMGDVGGHVVRPDGAGGIEVPTHDAAKEGQLPAEVREGRIIVYDHHHKAGAVSGAGGYANAAHMLLDDAAKIAAHVQAQIEAGTVRTIRFVSHSPPDLDSLTSHLVMEEIVDRVRLRLEFSKLLPDLARVHAANADKGILGRPNDIASRTMEGIIEGLNREVTTPEEQVREGKRFLRKMMRLAASKPWYSRTDPKIPEDRVPELIEELKGKDPMIRRAGARTDAIMREILELKGRAEGAGGEAVREGSNELARSMAIRETYVQGANGGLQKVKIASVEVNFLNPISKLVFHTLYQNGVDVVLIKSNNAKGINYFACVNGKQTGANLKGLMDPITQRLGLFDGSGYGNQINIGRVADDVRVHELGAEAARHGEVLRQLHARGGEFELRAGEQLRLGLEPSSGEASGARYRVEAVSEGGAARDVGSLRVDPGGEITVRTNRGGGGRTGGPPPGQGQGSSGSSGTSGAGPSSGGEPAPNESKLELFHRRFAERMRQAGVRLGDAGRSFVRGGSRSPAAVQATMVATMYLFALVSVAQAEPGLSADELLVKAGEAAFSVEALSALGAFVGVHFTAQAGGGGVAALAPVLQRIGVETGKEVFRIGERAITREGLLRLGGRALGGTGVVGGVGASHAVIGTFEGDRLQDARVEGVGRGIDAAALGDPRKAAELRAIAEEYFEKGTLRLLLEAMDPDRLDYTLVLFEGSAWILGQAGGTAASAGNPVVGFVAGASAATGVALIYEGIEERFFTEDDAVEDAQEVVEELAEEEMPESDGTPGQNARAVAALMKEYAAGYDTLFLRVGEGHSQANRGFSYLAEKLRNLAIVGLGKQSYYRERDRLLMAAMTRVREENGGRASFRDMQPIFQAFNDMDGAFQMRAYPGITDEEKQRQKLLARSGDVFYMGDSGVYRGDWTSLVPEREYWSESGDVEVVVRRALAAIRLTLRGFGMEAAGGRPPLGDMIRNTSMGSPLRKLWVGKARGAAAVDGLEALSRAEQERVNAFMENASEQGFPEGFPEVVSIQRALTAEKIGLHRLIQDGLETNLPRLEISVESVLADGVAQWERALYELRRLAGELPGPGETGSGDGAGPGVPGGDGVFGVGGTPERMQPPPGP